MFAKTLELELGHSSESKRTRYTLVIFSALLVGLVVKICWFSRLGVWKNRVLNDFDDFYIAAQRVWLGDIDQVYQFVKLAQMQREVSPTVAFMPWTYPPQFDLLIAPLAFLPIGLAYFAFTAATMGFYFLVLRKIAGNYFAFALFLLLPTLVITMSLGQNGFLTGGLVGLTCITLSRRRLFSGLGLGALIIKPHLAIALTFYSLLSRQWLTMLTGAIVVVATSILATLLLGNEIWIAFFAGAQESASYLEKGYYPLFRMISPYAVLKVAGFPSWVAFSGQSIVALAGLAVVAFAVWRGFALRWSLGLTALVSVLVSPYAYDYDLPILGIGLALLLPDLVRLGSERERAAVYGLIWLAGFSGFLQSFRLQLQYGGVDVHEPILFSIGGVAVVILLVLIFRILLRNYHVSGGVLREALATPS